MQVTETFPLRGMFELIVKKDGKVIETYCDNNLIVNGARNQAARLFAGDGTNRAIAKIAFGTSGAAPAVTDTVMTD